MNKIFSICDSIYKLVFLAIFEKKEIKADIEHEKNLNSTYIM